MDAGEQTAIAPFSSPFAESGRSNELPRGSNLSIPIAAVLYDLAPGM